MRTESWKKRALDVRRIVEQYYVKGRNDRCKLWVYRHHVRPLYYISERTFFRYLQVAGKGDLPVREEKQRFKQLELFE
jgi:hypothetical protein